MMPVATMHKDDRTTEEEDRLAYSSTGGSKTPGERTASALGIHGAKFRKRLNHLDKYCRFRTNQELFLEKRRTLCQCPFSEPTVRRRRACMTDEPSSLSRRAEAGAAAKARRADRAPPPLGLTHAAEPSPPLTPEVAFFDLDCS
jgi:hypothetical protein